MWIEEGLKLTVSHHRHGVKPPVPGGTRLPSLHQWGFLFLHLKSKPGPSSQQSSIARLSSPLLLFHNWAASHTQTQQTLHTHRLILEHHGLIYVCVIFNMFQISKYKPMQMRWRGQYHKLSKSLCSVICCRKPHSTAAVYFQELKAYNTIPTI